MKYENNLFEMVAKDVVTIHPISFADIRTFGFTFPCLKEIKIICMGIMFQKIDVTYKRTVGYYTSFLTNDSNIYELKITEMNEDVPEYLKKLENLSDSNEIIGILVTFRSDTYVFFRFKSAINYCTLDEVNTHFNQFFFL